MSVLQVENIKNPVFHIYILIKQAVNMHSFAQSDLVDLNNEVF